MPNIIGYKDLSNLYIKPAAEPTRTTLDINLKSASEPERVLNPIVSESYMRQYIEEHGGITPTGNIEITENGENINVAPFATATVNVSGGGNIIHICTLTVINNSGSEIYLGDYVSLATVYVDGGFINSESQVLMDDNETLTLKVVIQYFEPATAYMAFMLGEGGGVLSNNINCEQGEGEFEPLVLVIDNTQDCSATLTIGGNV